MAHASGRNGAAAIKGAISRIAISQANITTSYGRRRTASLRSPSCTARQRPGAMSLPALANEPARPAVGRFGGADALLRLKVLGLARGSAGARPDRLKIPENT